VNATYVSKVWMDNTSNAIATVQEASLMPIRDACWNGWTTASRITMKRLKYHIIVADYASQKSISSHPTTTFSKVLVKFVRKYARINPTLID